MIETANHKIVYLRYLPCLERFFGGEPSDMVFLWIFWTKLYIKLKATN